MTAEWAARQMTLAVRAGADALRKLLGCRFPGRDHCRFVCRAEEVLDETCPEYEDRFLCVRINGCIPTSEDNFESDIRVELLDITDGPANPEPVLSTSDQWHRSDSPVFYFQKYNGIIPCKNAVLAAEIMVVKIPLFVLRFARRGRRRLQASVSIVSRSDGQVIVSAQDQIEYIFCSEGFVEIQERREEVLRACIELACAIAAEQPAASGPADLITGWLDEKTRRFRPRSDIAEPLSRLQTGNASFNVGAACECLQAWGQKADRLTAVDLALQTAALYPALTSRQEEGLWAIAETLGVSRDRFLVLCQKRLLTDNCSYERWRLLLGVRDPISPEDLLQRLNEEYRKWNARVTHPDPQIRRQADIILSLIADVRNRHQKAESSMTCGH